MKSLKFFAGALILTVSLLSLCFFMSVLLFCFLYFSNTNDVSMWSSLKVPSLIVSYVLLNVHRQQPNILVFVSLGLVGVFLNNLVQIGRIHFILNGPLVNVKYFKLYIYDIRPTNSFFLLNLPQLNEQSVLVLEEVVSAVH